MTFDIGFEKRSNYIHAVVTGTNTADNVAGYMNAVRGQCEKEDCFRVLNEERLEGPRFDEMEIFQRISKGSGDALGFFEALAYVDEQQEFEKVKFAETVAVNRGIPIAVFGSVVDAENCLLHRDDDANEQNIFSENSDSEY